MQPSKEGFPKCSSVKCSVPTKEKGFCTSLKVQKSQTLYRKSMTRKHLWRSNYLIIPLLIKVINKSIFLHPSPDEGSVCQCYIVLFSESFCALKPHIAPTFLLIIESCSYSSTFTSLDIFLNCFLYIYRMFYWTQMFLFVFFGLQTLNHLRSLFCFLLLN